MTVGIFRGLLCAGNFLPFVILKSQQDRHWVHLIGERINAWRGHILKVIHLLRSRVGI